MKLVGGLGCSPKAEAQSVEREAGRARGAAWAGSREPGRGTVNAGRTRSSEALAAGARCRETEDAAAVDLAKGDAMDSGGGPRRSRGGPAGARVSRTADLAGNGLKLLLVRATETGALVLDEAEDLARLQQ